MKRFRFTLRRLLAVVGFAAVAFAALAGASELWVNAVFTITVAAWAVALVAAFVQRGAPQGFAISFAVCGVAYILLIALPVTWFRHGGLLGRSPALLTDKVVYELALRMPRTKARVVQVPGAGGLGGIPGVRPARPGGSSSLGLQPGDFDYAHSFIQISHLILSLLFALAGGAFARWLYGRRQGKGADQGRVQTRSG
ncbi:MAG: hypothetical protein HY000_04490 [Planctomycetes bacterium]|nr:hypothetical protein [Planctomycetota bacterium]